MAIAVSERCHRWPHDMDQMQTLPCINVPRQPGLNSCSLHEKGEDEQRLLMLMTMQQLQAHDEALLAPRSFDTEVESAANSALLVLGSRVDICCHLCPVLQKFQSEHRIGPDPYSDVASMLGISFAD